MAVEEAKIKQLEGKSDFFKDILDKTPIWILRWGNFLIFMIFLIICFGLSFIKYPEVIQADAQITSDTPPIEIYSKQSGRIDNFFFNDKDSIKKGDWVIELNNSGNYEDILNLFRHMEEIKTVDHLFDHIEEIETPLLFNLGDVQNAYSRFKRAVDEYKLLMERTPHLKQLGLNKRRQENLILIQEHLINQKKLIEQEYGLESEDLNRYKSLQVDSLVSDSEISNREIEVLNIKTKMENVEEEILNTNLEIDRVLKENATLENTFSDNYFRLKADIMEYYNALLFSLKNWENNYIISAPVDGILNLFEIRTRGEFVLAEQKLFAIETASEDEEFFALIELPVNNSGKLKIGQKCIIKLDNFSYQEFGMLRGNLKSYNSIQKEKVFKGKVTLAEGLVTTTGYTITNKNSLSGRAEIIVGDYTALERLINFLTQQSY